MRSGVRAISVSGKTQNYVSILAKMTHTLITFLAPNVSLSISIYIFSSSVETLVSLSVGPSFLFLQCYVYLLPSSLSALNCIHSLLFFSSHTVDLFPAQLAEDIVTSTPPKPTKARRFLLPFVFCSDSPPNGILSSHWTVSRGACPQNCNVAEKNS